ncbi:MAG: HEAT repeat domain-containing protein [Pirellulaceae bacterium]
MHCRFLMHGRVMLSLLPWLVLLSAPVSIWGQQTNAEVSLSQTATAAAVLASDATREEKLNACRRLAALGGQESIAPLVALLDDAELSHAARMGLEAIPDPAAGDALRAALPGLGGAPLIGVINSLAARREVRAVADLGCFLTHTDPQVAAAACAAVGTIASPDALTLLEDALPQVAQEVRPQWGHACLRAVAALHGQGLDDGAQRLCQVLRQAELPSHIHNAAVRQAMLIRPGDAGPLLQELLSSSDDASFAMALTVSRELDSPQVTQVLIASLPVLSSPRTIRVIRMLGDRGDPVARDALVQSASSSDVALRAAALLALGRTGDMSTIPLLLAAASDSDAEIVAAARQALVTLPGDSIDAAVVAAFAAAEGSFRRLLIEVIGQRRIESAAAELAPLASDPDESTRLAALRALGQVIDAPQLPVLTARLPLPADAEERDTVQQALRAACRRAVDKDACARELQACLPQLDQDMKPFLTELLGIVGGSTALDAVTLLARDTDDAIQDAATRELGRWRTPDVAPALIDLARTVPQEKYRIRALRGYLRVIRQMDLPDTDKLTMFRQAVEAATRSEERLLAIETLGRIPTPQALEEAVNQLEPEELRSTACAAAVAIAERIVRDQAAMVAEPMRRVLAATDDAEITRRAQAVLAQSVP